MNFLQKHMRWNSSDWMIYPLLPIILADVLIHSEKWEKFFMETDPLYWEFKEVYD